MSVQAIVFDFDGVLADSEMLHFRVYNELLSASGVQISRDEYYEQYLGKVEGLPKAADAKKNLPPSA